MKTRGDFASIILPQIGCFLIIAILISLCALPYLVATTFDSALDRLHLSRTMTLVAMAAILVGSLVNIPLYRLERDDDQFDQQSLIYTLWGNVHFPKRQSNETVIAINLGGCVIPLLLALNELPYIWAAGKLPLIALGIACLANIFACNRAAMLVPGVGIALPTLLAPVVAVGVTWLLLGSDYPTVRASVAFIAGAAGPLVGADLLNLHRISRVSVGMLSIGGAGTFDGIVLSAILAALLA